MPRDRIDPETVAGASRGLPRRAIASRTKQTSLAISFTVTGGGWAFHYDGEAAPPDEVGYHFADERFVVGEYVSINEHGKMHTYRVTTVIG